MLAEGFEYDLDEGKEVETMERGMCRQKLVGPLIAPVLEVAKQWAGSLGRVAISHADSRNIGIYRRYCAGVVRYWSCPHIKSCDRLR
jgi:hypothetical protein